MSEKPEDNIAAMEWGIKQGELIRKSEEITKRLNEKYTPIILEMERKRKGELEQSDVGSLNHL